MPDDYLTERDAAHVLDDWLEISRHAAISSADAPLADFLGPKIKDGDLRREAEDLLARHNKFQDGDRRGKGMRRRKRLEKK